MNPPEGLLPGWEALVALVVVVFASGIVLGLPLTVVALVARRLRHPAWECLIAAASVLAAAYPLARLDVMYLGGHLAWRFIMFAGASGAGYLVSRAVTQRRYASPDVGSIVATVGWGRRRSPRQEHCCWACSSWFRSCDCRWRLAIRATVQTR